MVHSAADSNENGSSVETRTPMVKHHPQLSGDQAGAPVRSESEGQLRSRRQATADGVQRSDSRTSRTTSFSLRRAATTMFTPEKKVGEAPGVLKSLYAVLTSSCKLAFGSAKHW